MGRSAFGRIVKRRKPDGVVVPLSYRGEVFPGYYLRIRHKGVSRTVKAGRTIAEARELLAKIQRELFQAGTLGVKPIEERLFEDFAEEYIRVVLRTHRETTAAREVNKIRSVLVPFFKGRLLSSIEQEDIVRFTEERERVPRRRKAAAGQPEQKAARAISKTTINRDLSALSSLFKNAVIKKHARINPVAGLKRSKEDLHAIPRLTLGQQQALIEGCPSWIRPLVVMGLDTGMRRGELLALEWPGVHFDRGVIVVERSKTGRPRDIPMTPRVRALLTRLASERVKPLDGPDRVFSWRSARWGGSDTRAFRAVARSIGAPALTFHGLRHNTACNLLDSGATLAEVRDLLGHTSLATALRYSRHVQAGAARAAVDRLATMTQRRAEGESESQQAASS